MGYWVGDEDDPWNQVVDAEREMRNDLEEQNTNTSAGALALFGGKAGGSTTVTSSLSKLAKAPKAYAAKTGAVVGVDLATDGGPASTVAEEGLDVDPNAAISDGIDAVGSAADVAPDGPDDSGGLPWWAYGLGTLAVLFVLAPYAELAANLSE